MFALLVGLFGSTGCGDDGSPSSAAPVKDAAVEAGKSDPKVTDVRDAGVTKLPTDAGVPVSTQPALDAIAGRYLMRWDTFGTATARSFLVTVSIRSRVSLLFVTELSVEGDHLKARERLCNQTVKQRCLDANGSTSGTPTCGTASTAVDQRVIDNFLHKTQFTRDYTLGEDSETITGGLSTAPLGYDGAGALPSANTDPRVWDPVPDQAPREGMLSALKVTNVGLFGVNCNVYGVQKFVTTFDGKLGGSAAAPTFPTMALTFTSDTVAAQLPGDNACTAAEGSPPDNATVQLVRHGESDGDDFWNCYDDSVFDAQLPATADSVIDAVP